jgi:hypothetical protein
LANKPRITSNGGGNDGRSGFHLDFINKGQLAIIKNIHNYEGDEVRCLTAYQDFEMAKNCEGRFAFRLINGEKEPNEMFSKIKINYFDLRGLNYEMDIQYNGRATSKAEIRDDKVIENTTKTNPQC